MKAYRVSRGTAPLIFNLSARDERSASCRGPLTAAPTEQHARWAPGQVWMIWRRERLTAPAAIRTPDRPAAASRYTVIKRTVILTV